MKKSGKNRKPETDARVVNYNQLVNWLCEKHL